MIEILDKYKCCGCEACVQTCPKHCISFKEDEEGFRYPQINKKSCIDCGLCEKVCPIINQAESHKPLNVYAAKNTNIKELLNSSSGGIFILLAKTVLRQGGVVFGAKFDENWNVIHAFAETEEEAQTFMGSKYVQSRIGNTYTQARDFLKQGRKVLFSGTPCQIAGLNYYLKKDYDNLLTVDVICHGVPSPKVWHRYLDEIKGNVCKKEKDTFYSFNHFISRRNSKTSTDVQIESISFRDKRTGWKNYSFTLTLAEIKAEEIKQVSFSHIFHQDPYIKLFLHNYILRPACYQCPAKNGKSQSDVTIADYWGVDKYIPDFYDECGVGLLMTNSKKGMHVISSLPIKLQETTFDDAITGNPMYMKSVVEPQKRSQCFRLLNYSNKSLDKVIVILFKPPFAIRVKQKIKKTLRLITNHHLL